MSLYFSEELQDQMINSLEDFKFWEGECYSDCVKDERGIDYDGETVELNWIVSCYQDGKCLLTINGKNYWFDSDDECNRVMIEIFQNEVLGGGI